MATDSPSRIKLSVRLVTDVGMVRDHNEDSAYVDDRMGFFIVADGMGGHAAGEVASKLAVDSVKSHLSEHRAVIEAFEKDPSEKTRKALVNELETSVKEAHQAVFDTGAKDADKQGMGTTLDVVVLAGAEAFVAHVGDSRTYLVRSGKASQLTTDHTVAEVLVIEGKLSVEEAHVSPLRTILVNAIGVAPDVGVEMAHVRLQAGDRILLCSDGLHDYYPVEQELAEKVKNGDPEKALTDMVELAKARGGHDNITGILVDIESVPATPVIAEDTEVLEETGVSQKPTDLAEDTAALEDMPTEAGPQPRTARESVPPATIEDKGKKQQGQQVKKGRRQKHSTQPATPASKKSKGDKKTSAKDIADNASESDEVEPYGDTLPGASPKPPR